MIAGLRKKAAMAGNYSYMALEMVKQASVDTYVDRSEGMGRGMFAERDFAPGEVIEIAPVLVVPRGQIGPKDVLRDYVFNFDEDNVMVALGYASMFNHSYEPNARYKKDKGSRTLTFTAIKPVKKGEEIFVNYNLDPDNKSPLWFDVKEKETEKTAESWQDYGVYATTEETSKPPRGISVERRLGPGGGSVTVRKNGREVYKKFIDRKVKTAGRHLREALEALT
jgi:hypothetical protein